MSDTSAKLHKCKRFRVLQQGAGYLHDSLMNQQLQKRVFGVVVDARVSMCLAADHNKH